MAGEVRLKLESAVVLSIMASASQDLPSSTDSASAKEDCSFVEGLYAIKICSSMVMVANFEFGLGKVVADALVQVAPPSVEREEKIRPTPVLNSINRLFFFVDHSREGSINQVFGSSTRPETVHVAPASVDVKTPATVVNPCGVAVGGAWDLGIASSESFNGLHVSELNVLKLSRGSLWNAKCHRPWSSMAGL